MIKFQGRQSLIFIAIVRMLKDSSLKDSSLKDSSLKDSSLKDSSLKDSSLKDSKKLGFTLLDILDIKTKAQMCLI